MPNEELKEKILINLQQNISSKPIILKKDEGDAQKLRDIEFSRQLSNRNVSILLDPLDATHSFIAKRYQEATILAGILVKNTPYIGMITSPFYDFRESQGLVSYFNVPEQGVYAMKKRSMLENLDYYNIEQIKVTRKKPEDTSVNKHLKVIASRSREEKLKSIFLPLLKQKVIEDFKLKTDNGMGYRSIKMIEEGYYYMTIQSSISK